MTLLLVLKGQAKRARRIAQIDISPETFGGLQLVGESTCDPLRMLRRWPDRRQAKAEYRQPIADGHVGANVLTHPFGEPVKIKVGTRVYFVYRRIEERLQLGCPRVAQRRLARSIDDRRDAALCRRVQHAKDTFSSSQFGE